ncbi:MAG: hypothetical protein ACR2QV_14470 [Gammaproteobacteria bacterium]
MKTLLISVACIAVAACAAPQSKPIAPETLSSFQGKSLSLVQGDTPSFVAMTSGKGMFAVAGVGAAAAAGNDLVEEAEIEDPAIKISRSLARRLTADHALSLRGPTLRSEDADEAAEIAQLAKGSDYALEVATSGWTYMYDGFKFGDYFVNYSSKLRLIDVSSSEVISSGLCNYNGKLAGKSAVTHEKLLENDAAYIKKELADAKDFCVQQFTSGLFQG